MCLSVCLSVHPQSFVLVAKSGASEPIFASQMIFGEVCSCSSSCDKRESLRLKFYNDFDIFRVRKVCLPLQRQSEALLALTVMV